MLGCKGNGGGKSKVKGNKINKGKGGREFKASKSSWNSENEDWSHEDDDWSTKAKKKAKHGKGGKGKGKDRGPWKRSISDRYLQQSFIEAMTTPNSDADEKKMAHQLWEERMKLDPSDWHTREELFVADYMQEGEDWYPACKRCQHIGAHRSDECPKAKAGDTSEDNKRSRSRGKRTRW